MNVYAVGPAQASATAISFKERSAGGRIYNIFMRFFPDFLHERTCCLYSFELPRLVDAIPMSTNRHFKCVPTTYVFFLYIEVDKDHGCEATN